MGWLKEVIVDIIATILIVISVLVHSTVLFYIIWGYTLLLLVIKVIALISDAYLNLMNKAGTGAPLWFSHLLYGINTLVLVIFGWWYAAACWVVIWMLSYLTQVQLNKRKA